MRKSKTMDGFDEILRGPVSEGNFLFSCSDLNTKSHAAELIQQDSCRPADLRQVSLIV